MKSILLYLIEDGDIYEGAYVFNNIKSFNYIDIFEEILPIISTDIFVGMIIDDYCLLSDEFNWDNSYKLSTITLEDSTLFFNFRNSVDILVSFKLNIKILGKHFEV